LSTIKCVLGDHGYDYFTYESVAGLIGQRPKVKVDGIEMPCLGTVVDAKLNSDFTITVTIEIPEENIRLEA
jgi:hypothetical protein